MSHLLAARAQMGVSLAFHIVFACVGVAMPLLMVIAEWRHLRTGDEVGTIYSSDRFLLTVVAAAPLGVIAVEAGWTVTEVGRQPWVIYGVMRTADAVTPMPGLGVTFVFFTILYIFLAAAVAHLLWRQVMQSPGLAEATALAAAGR
jgi:cytochrome bd ubiquinol oxidase subunit I